MVRFRFSPQRVTFDIIAADAATELFLIDGNFQLVKRGIGRERFSVTPGIYKIKSRSGKATTERLIVVEPGMPTQHLAPDALVSAMPLAGGAKTITSHMSAAHGAAEPPPSDDDGTAIVIVARHWSGPSPPAGDVPAPVVHPGRGLVLRAMSGEVLSSMDQASLETTLDPCVTMYMRVDSGPYRLRVTYEDGKSVEQIVIACKGWQTQVYLLLDEAIGRKDRRADLINAAMTLRRPSEGYSADDPMLRLEAIARQALEFDRHILSDEMRSRITSPGASPMLALFGAHLLIREAKDAKAEKADAAPDSEAKEVDNRPQVRMIVENLRRAIGPHPDVEAIAIGAGVADPNFVFEFPPLLRASWRLLLKASADRPSLIPAASFTSRVSDRMWGEGTWFLWVDPDSKESFDRTALWQTAAREILPSIVAEPRPAAAPTLVARVKSMFVSRVRIPFPELGKEPARARGEQPAADVRIAEADRAAPPLPTTLSAAQKRALVKRLGIPMHRIDDWFAGLNK